MPVVNPTASFSPHNGVFIYQHILTASEMQEISDNDDYLYNNKLFRDGSQVMTGTLNMGNNDILNPGLIGGVSIAAHASRHDVGGADPLAISSYVSALSAIGGI